MIKAVESYLNIRRALGFKLQHDEALLNSFARYAAEQGDTHVKTSTAIAWAGKSDSEPQRANRLKTVVRFALFSKAEDPRHEIPPNNVFCRQRHRPKPYIYTEDEIMALMAETLKLKPSHTIRPHLYNTLIGMLATTGMRISEALSLQFNDITEDGIIIRETKFRKSRLLPLDQTARTALEMYINRRRTVDIEDDHLFISRKKRPLSKSAVYGTFPQLLRDAGITAKENQSAPRLIDFRHTFATTTLAACPNSRDHIGSHILALSTYMGHAHVSSTYWYLENTPHLMRDIAESCHLFIEETST
jgi:integrase